MCIVFRMATKRKRNKLTLKTKYETLKEPDKSGPSKEVAIHRSWKYNCYLKPTNLEH